ncbi:hypothetical protein Q428_14665 [Fervidicella metallireducens AeB]|uniref:Uncharacterized protein n=1 Tax=Fervidicella metallireducens AeB TaxID=1403537 RepID=A0A017RRC2_9CLOT|nr:hypothetical protein [Fervidicella metallireducens]EYE87192.1 hypothetical protein Q428_14665 [Fervidicella metallireducens AeB]
MKIPELWELISLFESEPKYAYKEDKHIPWFYNTLEFVLTRGNDIVHFIISPAEGIIDFKWYLNKRLLVHLKFESIEELKIEKTSSKEILHIVFSNDIGCEKILIELKPVVYLYGSISAG